MPSRVLCRASLGYSDRLHVGYRIAPAECRMLSVDSDEIITPELFWLTLRESDGSPGVAN